MTTKRATAKAPVKKATVPPKKPLIWFFGLGGTIADRSRQTIMQNLEHINAVKKYVERAPDLHDFIRVKAEHLHQGGSGSLGAKAWIDLSNKINGLLAQPDVSGAVVAHGTSTMEEITYWLNLTIRSKKPVVVTGAMRSPSFLGTDADNSLLNTAMVVSAPESWGRGVMLVLNNEIHAARDVTKTNGYSRQTFASRELGILGYAAEEKFYVNGVNAPDHAPSFYRYPSRKHTYESEFDVSKLKDLPKVYIVDAYEGADAVMIDALIKVKAPGIVLAGMGGGAPAGETQRAALLRASKAGTVVVYTSRTGAGLVVRSEALKADGIVTGDNLNPYKARVLLQLALTRTKDREEIQRMFNTY